MAMLILIVTIKFDDWMYPLNYVSEVEKYAQEYKMEKAMIEAVMREESRFNEKAISQTGAIGLMQIMPETGNWIAQQLNEENIDLYDPELNIKYGTWYLSELRAEFGGNEVLELAAYNAGRGTVWNWIEQYGWDKDFSDIESIPYEETRKYVKNVLRSYKKYKQIYNW